MRHSAATAGLLALLTAATLAGPAEASGLLTITFDDASRTQYVEAFPIIKEFGVAGTLFVISGKADEAERKPGAWGMSWNEIAEFRDAGWEIGSHSDSHPDLTELPQEQVILELDVSRAEIEAHLDVQPVSFASPFGEYSDATLELIMQRYTYHALAYGGTEGRNPNPAVDPREIGRMNVDKDVAPEAVCNEARRASQNGTWLVLTFHTFQAVDPEKYQTSPEALRQILGCATELRDSGELRIVTLRQAMELMGGG